MAQLLRDFGFEGKRGVQYKGGVDSPDVLGLPGWHIEVKRVEAFKLYDALAQAYADKSGADKAVVFHRKNGGEWVAVLSAADFLGLVRGF